jgi:hypothetical protein
MSVGLPNEWANMSSGSSIVREKLESGLLRLQLYYPESDYAVYLYTEGPKIATPQKVLIEKMGSFKQDSSTYIKIKITFK